MLVINDFIWKKPGGEESNLKKLKLEYVYTPAFRFWIKDAEINMVPKPLMCIQCYKATSKDGEVAYMKVADCFGDHNLIETYWIQCSNEALQVKYIDCGELSRDNELPVSLSETNN